MHIYLAQLLIQHKHCNDFQKLNYGSVQFNAPNFSDEHMK